MREPLPDERLIDDVRAGDTEAAEVLFGRYQDDLLAFCRHMLGRRDAAETTARASFAQGLRVVGRHDRPVNIKALLFRIARQSCAVALDDRPRGLGADVDIAGLDPEVARDPELRALLASIAGLPLDQRAVLVLSELGGHRREDIAGVAGCPGEKVDALLAQARLALTGVPEGDNWVCAQVRPLLAAAGPAGLGRESLRSHVAGCEGCSEVRAALAHQRRCLAMVLPVAPAA